MFTFLILGLVPGTNIQISFQMWLNSTELLLLVIGLWHLLRHTHHAGRQPSATRQPLHANQLHLRAL